MSVITFDSYTLGCRVNHAETISIQNKLIRLHFKQTKKNPAITIINSCAVTSKAERETRQLIYQLKRKNPSTSIILTGCAATYWQKKKLWQNLPVDLLLDNTIKSKLPDILNKQFNPSLNNHKLVYPENSNTTHNKFTDSSRFLLKIQDGCQRFCTYCIAAYLRGKPKSVPIKDIVLRIKKKEKYINEIILTAVNTENFGKDTGENLPLLISEIAKKTSVPRFSFGSIHPWSLTDSFVDVLKDKIVKEHLVYYFHVPVQSGSQRILNLMKRQYDIKDIKKRLEQIASINKRSFMSTDIIVGFLDESKDDFQKTYELLEKSPFCKFHIFRYSQRLDTPSYFMSKKYLNISPVVKKQRANILQSLSDKKFAEFKQKLVGVRFKTLITHKKSNIWYGLLANQIPILVKSKKDLLCKIKLIKVVDYKKGNLFGKIIS